MDITIDQIKALQAVAEAGSFAKASEALGKHHSAIIYAIKSLETQTNLELLDRSQYRSSLTEAGQIVLESCRKLLEAEKNLQNLCQTLNAGWESHLRIVYEASLPVEALLKVLGQLTDRKIPTRIQLISGVGAQLYELKIQKAAQIVIALQPPTQNQYESILLTPYNLVLAISASHPLLQHKNELSSQDLKSLAFWTAEGERQNSQLSTATLELDPKVQVQNYESMISAISSGHGFGWVPEHMICRELRKKTVLPVPWSGSSFHTQFPRLYYKSTETLGLAEATFIEEFGRIQNFTECRKCGTEGLKNYQFN